MTTPPRAARLLPLVGLLLVLVLANAQGQTPAGLTTRWLKGNLHTHSLWSDGDDFPEMIALWYKQNGYQFLALSDHNILQKGERWIHVTNELRQVALKKYQTSFGTDWVQQRSDRGYPEIRLKTLEEFSSRIEVRNQFLLIPSEEVSDHYKQLPIHLNATNLRDELKPAGGTNVADVIQRNVDAVLAQRQQVGRPMIVHVNHPNFGWAITAEDLMHVRGERFFEVYNGHPSVNNEGDAQHASVERVWDILLSFRMSRLGLGPLYGLAVDDSHNYHKEALASSNPGRGWVMVRAADLSAESIIRAMESGDFYSSSGVTLRDVRRHERGLSIEIKPEPGVKYATKFVGTLRGFNPTPTPSPKPIKGNPATTGQYSTEIGTTLGVVEGLKADYTFAGDELYVRATVISSKLKHNPYRRGEFETAWVQPAILRSNVLSAVISR
jgi:hypothetical protein